MKKVLVAIMTLIMMVGLAACGGDNSGGSKDDSSKKAQAVNLGDMIKGLYANSTDLELEGKYQAVSDISDGSIDKELIGTWKSADGSYLYSFSEDGNSHFEHSEYDVKQDSSFTCITAKDKKVLCVDTTMSQYDENDTVTETKVVSYSTYKVTNDALYMVTVDTYDESMNNTNTTIIMLYKADDAGDISASIANNPIAPESLYGEWTSDEASVTIDANGMTVKDAPEAIGSDPLPIVINENGNITVEAQGKSTEYSFAFSLNRTYSSENPGTIEKECYGLNLFYVGKDENDKPSLDGVMLDWNKEYSSEEYRYSMNLSSK
ncbi:MAG: hypothetical protein IKQ71_06425 [Lachnospiraceae bacterium]|nr:hypothetical protein [Lachnospiraceae bacterium]